MLGICHAGVWKALEELELTQGITGVAGTSVGAIFATLASLRYTGDEIKAIVDQTDFSKFKDGTLFYEATHLRTFGLHPGKVFSDWMAGLIEAKTGNRNSTFADLRTKGCRDLTIYACNLNTRSITKFSALTTPNTPVIDAVDASKAVPGFFEAKEINGQIYADGGIAKNYPIDTWDNVCPNEDTIGSRFDISPSSPDNGLKFGDYAKWVESVFETMLNSQYVAINDNPDNIRRSIVCNTHGISALNFDVDNSDKQILFQSGRVACFEKFKN